MMKNNTEDSMLLLYKPEVFVYKIPQHLQKKVGHTHRAKDWNVSNPDWYGQLRLLSEGNSYMVLQLQNQPGDIFGECSIESYPGASIRPVKDSTRYFVLRVQTTQGGNYLYGLAFTSRADSEDLIKTLTDYFLKNMVVDTVVPSSPSSKCKPDDIYKSLSLPVQPTTPLVLGSVPLTSSSSPKRKLKSILKKPSSSSSSNGPVRLNRNFGAIAKSNDNAVKRVQVGVVEVVEFESDIDENDFKKVRLSPSRKQPPPEERLSNGSTEQEVENETAINIVLNEKGQIEADDVDKPLLSTKSQEEKLAIVSSAQDVKGAVILGSEELISEYNDDKEPALVVVESQEEESGLIIISLDESTAIIHDEADDTMAIESFYSPLSSLQQPEEDNEEEDMNSPDGETAMEQKCQKQEVGVNDHVGETIFATSCQVKITASTDINCQDSPEPPLINTGPDEDEAPFIKNLEELGSDVVAVKDEEEVEEPVVVIKSQEIPSLAIADQNDELATLVVEGQVESVAALANEQVEDSIVVESADGEYKNGEFIEASSQSTVERSKKFNVLQSVMNYLDWADLRSCRLVDSDWQLNASQVMLDRDLCGIKLIFDEKSKKFHQATQWEGEEDAVPTLKDLIECIQVGKSPFPCSSFSFQGGDLSAHEPQLFFETFGLKIKTLGILRGASTDVKTSTTQRMKEDALRKLLREQVPNVESLEISYFDYKSSKLNQRVQLPFLKSLTCARLPISSLAAAVTAASLKLDEEIKSTVFQLIQPSPMLKSVHNFKSKYTSRFFLDYNPNKIDFIKSYNLEIVGVKSKHLLKFALSKPKLEKLSVSYQFNPKRKKLKPKQRELAITVLNSILESSKHSLKELYMTALCLLDVTGEQLNIPQLLNLKTLTLSKRWIESGKKGQTASLFPKCVKIQHVFPNLQTVNVFLSCDRDSAWNEYFPSAKTTTTTKGSTMAGTFVSVTTLRIGGFCTRLWFQKLRPLFPTVTRLVLISKHSEGWTNMDDTMRGVVQNFPQLEQLEFLGCGWCHVETSIGNFDTAFTGLSQRICQKLSRSCINWPGDILCFKSHPSITDLKNLKVLKIRISNERWGKDSFVNLNLISWISKVFCFKLVPRLKVIVSYHKFCPSADKISAVLASLAPHVHVIHEKHEEEYV